MEPAWYWVFQRLYYSFNSGGGEVCSNQVFCCCLTLTLPPPGSCLTFSMEPTLGWPLMDILWDSIFTSPPPKTQRWSFTALNMSKTTHKQWWEHAFIQHTTHIHTHTHTHKSNKHGFSPGLCFMLALEPHFEVTLLKSTFLVRMWTCKREHVHNSAE